jgi:hypothetical protein
VALLQRGDRQSTNNNLFLFPGPSDPQRQADYHRDDAGPCPTDAWS